jgi:hypothetical protein
MIGFLHSKKTHKPWLIAGALIAIIVGLIIVFSSPEKDSSKVIIVLSPHHDDASLALGGFLSEEKYPTVIATFFTGTSTSKHKPFDAEIVNLAYPSLVQPRNGDDLSLEQLEITRDIQALLASYNDKVIEVYGPALFNIGSNQIDHELLHRAFIDVSKSYPKKDINFYVYEDYPYTKNFNATSGISLEKNLELQSEVLVERINYPLNNSLIKAKEKVLSNYVSKTTVEDVIDMTERRCGNSACEVVYKIFRVTE